MLINSMISLTDMMQFFLLGVTSTQNVLHSYIDSEINHIRQFIEIQLINKGI